MTPSPELSPLLKRLRLSGILDSLDRRNREAIENKLPYTDFLALLIADEVARREHKKYHLRLRRAGFRSAKTLEAFDFDHNAQLDQALIHELAACRFIEEKVAVLIAGPCGTGKSHIAQAIGHCAVREGYDVVFTTQSQLLGALHGARAINAFERRFQAFARVPYRASLTVIAIRGPRQITAGIRRHLHAEAVAAFIELYKKRFDVDAACTAMDELIAFLKKHSVSKVDDTFEFRFAAHTKKHLDREKQIVLVHGWTGDDASFGELPKFLADAFNVPATVYQYPTGWLRHSPSVSFLAKNLDNWIRNHANAAQLAMVAHSYGGFVVKRMLVMQREINRTLIWLPLVKRAKIASTLLRASTPSFTGLWDGAGR